MFPATRQCRGPAYRVGVRIAFLNWRDTANPEGGGSEVYVHEIARRLVERGHDVSQVCAAHGHAPDLEIVDGVRLVRRGSKLTVYGKARQILRRGALGPIDVIVDTQNGIPFLAPWAVRTPTIVLCHHVHREQWPVVYDPVRARIGWWVESRLAPWVYRRNRYVSCSQASADELSSLGVDPARITVVHPGVNPPVVADLPVRDPNPRILLMGRLVPHKRFEHALRAAGRLRVRFPGLTVAVVGDGWWSDRLRDCAEEAGVADIVEFTGFVTEEQKARELARAWVMALPSLKEGWGIVVIEAALAGVPTVAYRDAGGVTESIVDGETGLLVGGDEAEFTRALENLLTDDALREKLGDQARSHAQTFTWDAATDEFERVMREAAQQG